MKTLPTESSKESRPDIVDWAQGPSGFYLFDGPLKGRSTVLPSEHVALLRHLFPQGDAKFPYDFIVWSDVKKSFKTTTMAMLHLYFALFVDVPGEQYVLSNDRQGAKDRIFRSIWESILRNPYIQVGEDVKKSGDYINFSNGSVIRALPIDYAGDAGTHHSLVTIDEPWGISKDDHIRLMDELGAPVHTREQSVIVYTGYAGWEGKSVYWEEVYHRFFDEQHKPTAPAVDIDLPAWADGDSFVYWNRDPRRWYTDEEIASQRKKRRDNAYRRQLLNEWVPDEEVFIDITFWDRCHDDSLEPVVPNRGPARPMVLAIDASSKSDSTALVGRAYNPVSMKVDLVYHELWRPEEVAGFDVPVVDLNKVRARVLQLHRNHKVFACYYDPHQMHSIALDLVKNRVRMVELEQTSRRVQTDEMYYEKILGRGLANYEAADLREHVKHAVAVESGRGSRMQKKKTTRKIDGAVADAMAVYGALEHRDRFERWSRRQARPVPVEPPSEYDVYRRDVGYSKS